VLGRVRSWGRLGDREGDGGSGLLEQDVGLIGDFPTGSRNFDQLAPGIAEIELDALEGKADAGNTAKDEELLLSVVVGGLGFEVIEDGVEGAGIGQGLVATEVLVKEPVAKGGGADGEDKGTAEGGSREADAGASVAGHKGVAFASDVDERF